MLIGIGNDIVEIQRIKKAVENKIFLEKVYTESEIKEAEKKGVNMASSLAGKFSAKEAVSKALGTGVRGFKLLDIEILSDNLGKPEVYFKGNLAEKMKENSVQISISHCKEYATAVAIVMRGAK
ncbi:holo-ACP synthase [Fusobacterium sp.]|uniref:holo-ACP synthase n=1 Tax=Fusobacterium sp. TaxID=68766 RepID=UPI00396C52DD